MRTVLITGSSAGFGLLTVVELAKRGWRVIASMRNLDRKGPLEAALKNAGAAQNVDFVQLDVTDAASIAKGVEETLAVTGGFLDAVIHNAGVAAGGAFEDIPDAELRRVMETNFFGVMTLTRALLPTFRKHRAAWDRWVDLVDLEVERFPIPYESTTLPGYFFRAPGVDPGARGPVVLAVNGSDGSLPALWSAVVSGAVRRGYHALVFDGPGQQSVLFEHGVPFRPDFEAVLTPVLDAVVARADVDPGRVAVYGISQGGYWVTRALAFEHRPAAAVVDPGVVDVATSWEREVPKSLLKLLDKGDDHAFDRDMALGLRLSKGAARTWRFRARPYGEQGYAATLREVRRYDASDVAAQVTTPLLVTSPEDEQFWPGQPERLAGLVPGATLVTFSDDEGASGHCEPLGRALVAPRVRAWRDPRLAR